MQKALETLIVKQAVAEVVGRTAVSERMTKVTVEMPVGTPLERTQQELASIRSQIEKLPGVASTYVRRCLSSMDALGKLRRIGL